MMEQTQESFTGWCCIDCLMILANGEDNPEWTADETEAHHAAMDHYCQGCDVTLGLLASDHDCPYGTNEECDCAQIDFTWRSCDTCGSQLGGSRDAVTFWVAS